MSASDHCRGGTPWPRHALKDLRLARALVPQRWRTSARAKQTYIRQGISLVVNVRINDDGVATECHPYKPPAIAPMI